MKEICGICGKELASLLGLAEHITKMHKDITAEQYYLKYINSGDNKCPICGKKREFIDFVSGYTKTCKDVVCRYTKAEQQRKETLKERYNETNCMRVFHIKEKMKSNNKRKTGYEWPIGSPAIREKVKEHFRPRGVEYAFQLKEVIALIKETKLKNSFGKIVEPINQFLKERNLTIQDILVHEIREYKKKKGYLPWISKKFLYLKKNLLNKHLILICNEEMSKDILFLAQNELHLSLLNIITVYVYKKPVILLIFDKG